MLREHLRGNIPVHPRKAVILTVRVFLAVFMRYARKPLRAWYPLPLFLRDPARKWRRRLTLTSPTPSETLRQSLQIMYETKFCMGCSQNETHGGATPP